jgi:hypothetical protein
LRCVAAAAGERVGCKSNTNDTAMVGSLKLKALRGDRSRVARIGVVVGRVRGSDYKSSSSRPRDLLWWRSGIQSDPLYPRAGAYHTLGLPVPTTRGHDDITTCSQGKAARR